MSKLRFSIVAASVLVLGVGCGGADEGSAPAGGPEVGGENGKPAAPAKPAEPAAAPAEDDGKADSAGRGARPHEWSRFGGSYEGQSAAFKQAVVWDEIEASEYASYPGWTGLEALPLLARALDPLKKLRHTKHMNVTMDRLSDVMPEGRKKVIHTYGSSVLVSFEADGDSPYTGLYEGAEYGLLRLSLAKKPDWNNSTPGMGVKLFVDGNPSANFVIMNSLDGQTSHDFFENAFSNVLAEPSSALLNVLKSVFELATKHPLRVSVEHLSKVDQDGNPVDAYRAPEKLVFRPSAEIQGFEFNKALHEVRQDFEEIPAGTVLYEAYGGDLDSADDDLIYVGRIRTTSRFIASSFGDEHLFFNHQRFNGE